MSVPEPLGALLGALHADRPVRSQHLLLRLGVGGAQILREAAAHDEDVALFEGGPLVRRDGFEVGDGDAVVGEAVVGGSLVGGVGAVVEQDAAAHEAAAGVPVVEGGEGLGGGVVGVGAKGLFEVGGGRFAAVVARAAGLVVEVYEGVPLGGALGVELDLVVEAVQAEGAVFEGEDFVDETFLCGWVSRRVCEISRGVRVKRFEES